MRYLGFGLGLLMTGIGCFGWYDTYVNESLLSLMLILGFGGTGLMSLCLARILKVKPAGYGVAALVGLALGGAIWFGGKAVNLRSYEANSWHYAEKGGADAWKSYLYSMGGMHEPLGATREPSPELVAKVATALELANTGGDHDALYVLKVHLDQYRGSGEDATWWLDTFTPVRAHFAEAARQYAEARFRETMAGTPTVGALRAFRLEFEGQHDEETAALLRTQYVEAAKRYDAMIEGKKTDPELVAGIKALLRPDDVDAVAVAVVFEPVKGLETADLEALAKDILHVRGVFPVAPSFTTEQVAAREDEVLQNLIRAFNPVSGSVFALSRKVAPDSPRRIVVALHLAPSGQVFSDTADDGKPNAERMVAIGIAVRFDCTLEVKGQPPHRFTLSTKPAAQLTVSTVDAERVYSAMSSSAYDAFSTALLRNAGF
jgi:hypothetical protein